MTNRDCCLRRLVFAYLPIRQNIQHFFANSRYRCQYELIRSDPSLKKGRIKVIDMMKVLVINNREETDSECIPRRPAKGLASGYKKTIPYVKIP